MNNAPRVTKFDVNDAIVSESYTVLPNERTTVCQLVLDNGFSVEGMSACVSKENFDAEYGQSKAREKALDQVWMLLGFRLADQIMRERNERARDAGTGRFISDEAAAADPDGTIAR